MGAIASGDVRVLNEEVLESYPVSLAAIESVTRTAASGVGTARAHLSRRPAARADRGAGRDSGRRRAGDRFDDAGGGTGRSTTAPSARHRSRARRSLPDMPRTSRGRRRGDLRVHPGTVQGGRTLVRRLLADDGRRGPAALGTRERRRDHASHAERVMRDSAIVEIVQQHAIRVNLETAAQRLLDAIEPRVSLVMIGEATHGTHEFYRIRADLTRALIQHRGFTCVVAEADWPDAYRANRWVRLSGDDRLRRRPLRTSRGFRVDVAQPRSRALPPLAPSRECRPVRGHACRLLRMDSGQPASIDGARHRVPRKSTRRRPGRRVAATPASMCSETMCNCTGHGEPRSRTLMRG